MSAPRPDFELTPDLAVDLLGGIWQGDARSVTVHGAAIDSRQVKAGDLFACFVGAAVDGHEYAAQAVENGAALVLASRAVDVSVPVIVVADVTAALATLATTYRQAYQGAVWIGVTGSNGKTTVKELMTAACSPKGPVTATYGNLNNHLGVPLTVLNTPPDQAVVIVEMGASGRDEIAHLAAIAQPDIGVITSIGPAHLDGFGSLTGVARGKGELFSSVRPGSRLLFGRHGLEEVCAAHNCETSEILSILRECAAEAQLTVVGEAGCAVEGECGERGSVLRTPVGEVGIRLVGEHNLANACLAWHAAVAAGVDPAAALGQLATVPPSSGRLDVRQVGKHRLLDDAYNANPASMVAGLRVLARQSGARLAVLGGMGELGADSDALHASVGATAAGLGLPLITVGADGQVIGDGYTAAGGRDHLHVDDVPASVDAILKRFKVAPTAVLIKASRSAGLDAVARGILSKLGYASGSQPAVGGDAPC